ncbi:hypothetical protein UAJ10_02270 [Nitrospirillum sp. BR 11164]|uniref:hypothetical protein n=1 Tax=Nitrospirillum sp. BR 11164 TaxID=3104324 RepID=UPI002AFEA054|nr:hypothetical protein [Nitrospirillum sp. BR 11164]MEA1647844.1 hypothetical protein [Nitrospirillum sp. BR 11164]
MIWLVGNSDDPKHDIHIFALKEACARAGIPVSFVGPGCDLQRMMQSIDSDDLIVWRYKMTPPTFPQSMDLVAHRFAALEWREALFGACASTGARVLNGYDVITVAGCKPLQLRVAAACGFTVPRHAILHDKDQITQFVSNLDPARTIRKPIAGYDIPDPADLQQIVLLSPTLVNAAEIKAIAPEQFSACPTMFQEYVEKQYELRVVAVGGSIIAYKIESQLNDSTKIDWRMGILRDMYSITDINDDLKSNIFSYLERFGLFSGVFDLVVKPDNSTVFLECNPNGQWMWLDYLKPMHIADTFIAEIINFSKKKWKDHGFHYKKFDY